MAESTQKPTAAARELERRAAQQAGVAELGRRAIVGARLPELNERAVELVAEGLDTELVSILHLAEDREHLVCRASVGWEPGMVRRVPLAGGSQIASTFLDGDPVVVADFRSDERFRTSPHLLEHGVVCGVSVPVRGDDRPVGVLAAHSREERAFDADDVIFLRAVANVVAAAVARERAESAREQSEERLRFLAEASHALSRSLDYRQTLNELARQVVPRLADWCAIELVENGRRASIAVAHADPQKVSWAREVQERYPPRADERSGVSKVLRTGRAELHPHVTEPMLEAVARDQGELEALRTLGMTSVMIVPLVAREDVLGAISFVWAESAGRYDEADLALAEDLARRAALAVDNARLHRAAVDAATRLARLQAVTARLAQALTVAEVIEVLLHALVDEGIAATSARAGLVGLVDAAGEHVTVRSWRGYDGRDLDDWHRFAVADELPLSEVVRTRHPVYVSSRAERNERYPKLAAVEEESFALATLPLLGESGSLGGIVLSFGEDHAFDPEERELLETIAQQAGQALERALLQEQRELAAGRISRLQAVTAQLSQVATRSEVAEVMVTAGAGLLGADAGWVAQLADDGARLEMIAAVGYPEDLAEAYRVLPLERRNPTTDAVRDRRPLWFRSAREFLAAYPGMRERYNLFEAMAVVPLVVGGEPLGLLALNFLDEREFSREDRALLETLAQQCGQALERARLYDERAERANAAFVLSRVADGVFQLDDHGCIRFWNPAAARITGVAEAEALGRPAAAILGRGWQEAARARGDDETRTALLVEVGGRELWLSISGGRSGEGAVFAFRDLTGEHRLEELRRDFVSTASHELRTPLAAVYGAARTLLERRLAPDLQQRLLEMIVNEGERLSRVVDDLLLANRLDVGQVGMRLEPTDAARLAGELVQLARQRAPESLSIVLEGDAPAPVLADPARLRQILANLLDNAIKYSPDGGAVVVAVRANGGRVRLSVADRGLGIPESEQRHVFEKFYRLDPELTRGIGGTGLGLYISRELVRQMDGRIWLESRPGEGSTFTVELPATA